MGTYLSKPMTEKVSNDDKKRNISYGASSMQGWRIYQEDAHNTLLDFEDDSCFFAVYDGHGGHEVAEYAAANLPHFVKTNENYQKGNYSEALKEAFLKFDSALLEPETLLTLKEISGTKDEEDSDYDGEEVNHLCREATMPLEEVMAKYSEPLSEFYIQNIKNKENSIGECSKSEDTASAAATSSKIHEDDSCSSKTIEDQSCSLKLKDTDISESSTLKTESSNKLSSAPNACIAPEISSREETKDPDVKCDKELNNLDLKKNSENSNLDNEKLTNHSLLNGETAKEDNTDSNTGISINSNHKNKDSIYKSDSLEEKSISSSENISTSEDNEKNPFKKKKNNSPKLEPVRTDKRAIQKKKALQIIMEQSLRRCNADGESEDEDDVSYGEISVNKSGLNGDDSNSDSEDEVEETSDESEEDSEAEDDEDEEEDVVEDDKSYNEFAMNMREEPGFDSGCTACVVLVVNSELIVANVGDSRCVVCRSGEAVDMSVDHKPEDDEETARIRKAGGKITSDGRVNGGLNLSRALGDHSYKQNKHQKPEEQMISPCPDIRTLKITPEDEFMIIACDGIWNSMSSQEACDFVSERLKKGSVASSICEEMFDHCLAPDVHGDGTGCDNMTCIIVRFNLQTNSESNLEENEKKRNLSDSDVTENCIGSIEKKPKLELTTNGISN